MNKIPYTIALMASLALTQFASAAPIFYDDFSGAAGDLDERTPTTTTGGGKWFSEASTFQISGTGTTSIDSSNTAFLDWTPSTGNIYELSVDMTSSGTTTASSTFGGIGFFNQKSSNDGLAGNSFPSGTSPTTPWAFVRTGNTSSGLIGDTYLRPLGSGTEQANNTNYTVTNTLNLKLVLNTNDTDAGIAGNQFSLDLFVNDVQVGTTHTYSDTDSNALLSNIKKVGLTYGGTVNSVSFDNFELTAIPEPSSLALIAIALGSLVFLRRRRA